MAQRISASLVILLSLLFAPFWLSAILVLAAMLYFDLFLEALFLLLLSDLLYGVDGGSFLGTTYTSFLLSAIALAVIEFIKTKTVFYPNKINK